MGHTLPSVPRIHVTTGARYRYARRVITSATNVVRIPYANARRGQLSEHCVACGSSPVVWNAHAVDTLSDKQIGPLFKLLLFLVGYGFVSINSQTVELPMCQRHTGQYEAGTYIGMFAGLAAFGAIFVVSAAAFVLSHFSFVALAAR